MSTDARTHDGTQRWEARTRLELARSGLGRQEADDAMTAVARYCAESGESPAGAFGSPEGFAASAFAARPARERAGVDRQGLSPADHLSRGPVAVAFAAVAGCLYLWATGGFLVTLTPAGLTGSALTALVLMLLFGVPGALRAAGRVRLAMASHVLWVALVPLAAAAFVELPRTELARVPVLVPTAAALLVAWLALVPTRRSRPSGPHTSDGDLHAWLDRLDGLLVGRHDVPRDRAADLVAEARAHLAESEARSADEFGPADEYAAELAAHERPADRWWRRDEAKLALTWVVIAGIVAGNVATGGPVWVAAVGAVVLVVDGWLVVRAVRDRRGPGR